MNRLLLGLVLSLVLSAACQSRERSERKYCELANAAHVYDPKIPGLCEKDYKSLADEVRTCLDECIGSEGDAHVCVNRCIPQSPRSFHPVPGHK